MAERNTPIRVLVVDDEAEIRDAYKQILDLFTNRFNAGHGGQAVKNALKQARAFGIRRILGRRRLDPKCHYAGRIKARIDAVEQPHALD